MPPRWILRSRRRAWLGYGVVVGVLLMTAAGLAQRELQHNLDTAREATQRELEMAGALVADALRRGQYRSLDFLLRDWAKTNNHLTELRVIGLNDLVLGAYRHDTTPAQSLSLSLPIDYSYRGRATLSLTRDLTGVHEFNTTFRNGLLLEVLLLSGLLGAALFLLLKRQDELQEALVTKQRLRASEDKYRNILTQIDEGYYEVTLAGDLSFVNPAFARTLGCSERELLGANNRRFADSQTSKKIFQVFNRVYRDGEPARDLEVEIVRADGARRVVSISVQLIRDKAGAPLGFRGFQRDITGRKEAERALKHQSLYDALTDLPNRYLLNDRLAQAIQAAERDGGACALLILDLDNFKEINDTLGHAAGDEVLLQVSSRLRGCMRDTYTLARLGGDEFAVILPDADEPQAERVARRILEVFEAPFSIDGLATQINVSIGVAQYPQHGQIAEELLRHADVAMYAAKHDRGGHVLYVPTRDTHSRSRLALSAEFNGALERDELVLYYQPILRLRDHALVGMEALTRWRHPRRGLILPQEFIPQLERQRLIRLLTLWGIETAARQSALWRALGLDIPIAINLSPKLLRDETFVGETLALLDSNHAGPWLELEITENALMENPVLVLERLKPLRLRGVRLSIDDFGTGYSSLAYLREFQADTLKIDQAFVQDMATNENKAVIVRAIVQLAHNLGIGVVAEGVENQETYDRLRALGCDTAQGFHLARPMPAEECMSWVDEMLATQDRARR